MVSKLSLELTGKFTVVVVKKGTIYFFWVTAAKAPHLFLCVVNIYLHICIFEVHFCYKLLRYTFEIRYRIGFFFRCNFYVHILGVP